jgi:para-nitrobenzyl esterase
MYWSTLLEPNIHIHSCSKRFFIKWNNPLLITSKANKKNNTAKPLRFRRESLTLTQQNQKQMNNISSLLRIAVTISFIHWAQNSVAQCSGDNYRIATFENVTSTPDITYGNNINYQGNEEQLLMDVYEPQGDMNAARPLLIMCHGGFFLAGDKAGADMLPLCQDFARRGYVVASINYRMGVNFTGDLEPVYGQAVMRAVQDLRAAVRWFRADASETNTFRVDTNFIFTGGASAGAFMALHHAYMDENEIPDFIDMSGPGLNGNLEGNSGNPGYSSSVKGIISVAGALGDSDWIDASDTVPAMLFHGDADQTVTIDSAMFVLYGMLPVTVIEGSNYINQRMDEVGLAHCYRITPGGNHVAYLGDDAEYQITLNSSSDFMADVICDNTITCLDITTTIAETKTTTLPYPNPCSDLLHLPSEFSQGATIYDAQGKMILSTVPGQNSIQLDFLSSGVYYIKSQNSNTTVGYAIILQND